MAMMPSWGHLVNWGTLIPNQYLFLVRLADIPGSFGLAMARPNSSDMPTEETKMVRHSERYLSNFRDILFQPKFRCASGERGARINKGLQYNCIRGHNEECQSIFNRIMKQKNQ